MIIIVAALIAWPFMGQWGTAALLLLALFLVWQEVRLTDRAERAEQAALRRAEDAERRLDSMVAARDYERPNVVVLPRLEAPRPYQ
jgi:hypothetical protein